ncbi:hypothetical protein PAESOLCIP111_06393 [Paenibacillus solanacearum]|uniref:Endonuclease/exonuclease/phosphatase domain-containing protein n=1 Tax=Paenibacillus solanacearum TaxID=2048548 RepID=A0A916NM18_9BACL|nr:endonuclease/exonuclease/phosphatase family protein [Paenibacillus solanacearum]CAG7651812.1 hypothetical protein PAESOLCIP111_06393 [Paenibacillus solanacearum]
MNARQDNAGNDSKFRIMTSNIWGNCGDNAIANRDDNLADVFMEYMPDVLGLQEVSPKARREPVSLFDLLDGRYTEVAVPIGELSNNYTPLLHTQRLTVLESGFHRFSGLNDSNSKSITWAVFECTRSGQRFAVCNVHFYWKSDQAGEEARRSNSRELMSVADAIQQRWPVPVCCIGDFNCRIGSAPVQHLFEHGFLDAQVTAAVQTSDSNAHHPYPKWDEAQQAFVHGPAPTGTYREAIDHVFYRGDQAAVGEYVTVLDQKALDASDHCPVYADFSFEGGGKL